MRQQHTQHGGSSGMCGTGMCRTLLARLCSMCQCLAGTLQASLWDVTAMKRLCACLKSSRMVTRSSLTFLQGHPC